MGWCHAKDTRLDEVTATELRLLQRHLRDFPLSPQPLFSNETKQSDCLLE